MALQSTQLNNPQRMDNEGLRRLDSNIIIPRWYQSEAIQSIYDYFLNGGVGNPLIAIPTAGGKSLIPAIFIKNVMMRWPNQRFLIMCHVKELIRQNYDKMLEVWPEAPAGIYSAGLKKRDMLAPIIFGGIQSMIKVAEGFGKRDLIFIDESHMISQDENSQYLKFIALMKAINPNLKIVGMTATPFRMGQGYLTQDGLFTDLIYDLTKLENFNKLISEGFLAPLVPRPTSVRLDVSNVGMQKGEFIQSQLQHEVDKAEITWKALQELIYYGQNRKSWLIFASGIEHSDHIAQMLEKLGVNCASVHSKQTSEYNDAALKAHKNLELKAISSFSKLTTGLDHRAVDLIADLRPTMSVVLHIQKYGRGMRLFPGKRDCIVLDYAGNVPRLGCVNDPIMPRKKGDKTGEIPIKICEGCGVYCHISARTCDACGKPFEFKVKIVERASTTALLKNVEAPVIETFDVNWVTYTKKQKDGKAPYIVATHYSGLNVFKQYIFPENHRFPKTYVDWWRQRSKIEPPKSVDECMGLVSELRAPKKIRVHVNRYLNGKVFPEILSAEW